MIREFWNKLDSKQRYFAAGGVIFVVVALLLELVVFPFGEAKGKIKQSLRTNEKKLDEIIRIDAEFTRQEAKMAVVKKVLATRPVDFSLFAYLERKATQAGVRGNIKNMNSSRGMQTASYEEALIDIKLDKITIRQLTDFLYYTESPADLVRIKRITISKMKESPEYLTAQLQLASLQILNSRPGGR
jgi:type II secretory pathway component PulM